MERLKFEIKENPDLKTKTIFELQIYQDKWLLWYNEVMRRIKVWEQEVFDVDEASELWVMSKKHFEAMDKFLFENVCKKVKEEWLDNLYKLLKNK